MVDFAKVEENLRRFEELYRQFLNYGGRFGEGAEEVHLVAVVCEFSFPFLFSYLPPPLFGGLFCFFGKGVSMG